MFNNNEDKNDCWSKKSLIQMKVLKVDSFMQSNLMKNKMLKIPIISFPEIKRKKKN